MTKKRIHREYNIYALIDPRDNHVRYVGMTEHLEPRLEKHRTGQEGSPEKQEWIQELKTLGLHFGYTVLATCRTPAQAREREMFWIGFYLGRGEPLTNKEAFDVTPTQGRKSTTQAFLKELQQYRDTGVCSWSHDRRMRHYAKKRYGIVAPGEA